MKDRLNSLYRHSPRQATEVLDEIADELLPDDFNVQTDSFLQEILVQRQAVSRLREGVSKVNQLHRLLLAALDTSGPDIDCVNEMIKRLDNEFQENENLTSNICKAINEMKRRMGVDCSSSADNRVRKGQLMGLSQSLRQLLIRFNQDYIRYEEASRQRAIDYAKRSDVKDTEAETILGKIPMSDNKKSEPSPSLERPQLMRTVSAFDAVLQEIHDRHTTICRVEMSIVELESLFNELKLYAETGNQLTNHIEKNIEQAGEYADKTKTETAITVQRQDDMKKGRGWMGRGTKSLRCMIVFLSLFIFLLITTLFWIFLHIGLRL